MTSLGTTATIAAVVTTGLTGGIYLAFTTMVLPALHGSAAAGSVATMQRINVAAVRGPFMIAFFGSVITAAAAAAIALVTGDPVSRRALRLVGAGLAVTAFMITAVVNVPLNDALAAVSPDSTEAAEAWGRYTRSWGPANLVRALVSIAATATLAASLLTSRC